MSLHSSATPVSIGDKGKDKKFFGPTVLPPPSSSESHKDYPPYKDITDNDNDNNNSPPIKGGAFFPTMDGKLPPKVPQVKPNKSKYNKDPYGDHVKNSVDQKPGQRPSLVDINNHPSTNNNKDIVNTNLPHGIRHPGDVGEEEEDGDEEHEIGHHFGQGEEEQSNNNNDNNSNDADYPIGRPPANYPGPGFFNPSASKNQFQDLNYQQHPGQQYPQQPQRPGGGFNGHNNNNNNNPQVIDKNIPPNELYQILTGQGVPVNGNGQQQLTFEQILQHIQAIDGQSGPIQHPGQGQQQQRPTNPQQPHLPPFLTGHLNQNNVNFPQFGGIPNKLPPGMRT